MINLDINNRVNAKMAASLHARSKTTIVVRSNIKGTEINMNMYERIKITYSTFADTVARTRWIL